jgi:hypothetical protein
MGAVTTFLAAHRRNGPPPRLLQLENKGNAID